MVELHDGEITRAGAFGSTEQFDDDWRRALATKDRRYLIYPSLESGRQADLFEWIKAQQIDALLSRAGIDRGSVLEYGCGAAGISLYLARHGFHAHLCDLSPYALHIAEVNRVTNAPEARLASAVVANVLKLPYATNSFDVVMSYGLLEHFTPEPLDRLLGEAVRVLRPGGLFIADIVPGPGRVSVRTLGVIASYLGSLAAHLANARWRRIPSLYQEYFAYYYESTDDDLGWRKILARHRLLDLRVDVCRPFPPLAIAGRLEKSYTGLIRHCLPFHRRFDTAPNWLTRHWGWMYLVSGRKQP